MIKRIIYFIVAIIVLFILSYPLHNYVVTSQEISLSYSLLSIYIFHIISAIIIYCIVEAIANYLPSQAGYGYLASVFLKLGFFVLIFKNPVFTENLSKPERISLVIPLFLFLISEALGAGKLLNSK